MIQKIGHYSLENPSTIYDEESLTALQLVGRTAAKVNECVDEVNGIPRKIIDDVQKHINNGDFNKQIDNYTKEVRQQIVSTEKQISAEMDAMETRVGQEIDAIDGRVDNLLNNVPEGSTTRDAEVIDIRTDFNGNTHESAGAAVRTQLIESRRDYYQTVGAYGYIGWDAPFTYEYRELRGETYCTKIIFNDYPTVYYKGTLSRMRWTTENCADIAEWVDIFSETSAIVWIPPYYHWVYNIKDGVYHMRQGANLLDGDISLVKTGYAYPVGGTMFDENNLREINKIKAWITTHETYHNNQAITRPESALRKYGANFESAGDVEAFIFYTDPHTLGWSGESDDVWKPNFDKTIAEVSNAYSNSGADFVVCGGDWLNNGDTYESARYKLGVIRGSTRKAFGNNHYHVLGNHDTNYQGVTVEGAEDYSGELPRATLKNLWGKLYYTFTGRNMKFFVIDTGVDWTATVMGDYEKAQVEWFANELKNNAATHIGIFGHMLYVDDAKTIISAVADNVLKIAKAFNDRTTVTFNGKTYDFTGCVGEVIFYMFGHMHDDCNTTHHDICCVGTTQLVVGGVTTYDLCVCDISARKLKLTRVGSGSSRSFDI